jgi:two-component sensor histidine kinase
LSIWWRIEREPGRAEHLVFSWRERSTTALDEQDLNAITRKGGFGTKLLDATMRVELGGSITTSPDKFGIDVTIRVPYERVKVGQQA